MLHHETQIYNEFGNMLQKTIGEIKRTNPKETYENILIYCFECFIIGFCEKYDILNQDENKKNEDRYLDSVNSLQLYIAGNFSTTLFRKNKYTESLEIMTSAFFECFDKIYSLYRFNLEDLGSLFEIFFNKEVDLNSDNLLVDTQNRKDEGMFFSNKELVKYIIRNISKEIRKKGSNFSCLDPAMGAGVFLFCLLDEMQDNRTQNDFKYLIEHNIFGIDKNPLLVDIFRMCLWVKYQHLGVSFDLITKHFCADDSLLLKINNETQGWRKLFPNVFEKGGFDYVVGNPPWGRIKANIREYNIFHSNVTEQYQGDALKNRISNNKRNYKKWESYKKYISKYSIMLKRSPNYQHQKYEIDGNTTGGDADLYKYFIELSFHLLKEGGKIGIIIPASFYMSESATGLRHLLLENGDIEYLINFENKRKIFPIHSSYKFLILIYKKNNHIGSIKKAVFNLVDVNSLKSPIRYISYSQTKINTYSPNYWTIPECENEIEQNLLHKLYKSFPLLNDDRRRLWSISFNRELDMTLDSGKFITADEVAGIEEEISPVYEGRMVNQYNSSKKIYVSGNGRKAIWDINNSASDGKIKPHYFVENKERLSRNINSYRAGYCEVTGQKNVRTILSSLIPANAICGNKVPTCTFYPSNDICFHLFWIGVSNSFVLDWIMRKKITITLNFYHWNQIPFPRLDSEDERFIDISICAAIVLEKTNGFDLDKMIFAEYKSEEYNRYLSYKGLTTGELREKIDCVVASIYNLDIYELALIMLNFPAIDSGKRGIPGDIRYNTTRKTSYVTRDSLLQAYLKWIGQSANVSIVDLYENVGFDISEYTGEIENLAQRILFYTYNDIVPYE